jgi:hypothetical protein
MTYKEQSQGLNEIQIDLLKIHQKNVADFLEGSEDKPMFLDTNDVIRSHQRWQKAVLESQKFDLFCKDQKIDMDSEIMISQKFTFNEMCDYVLGLIYQRTKVRGMLNLLQTMDENKIDITREEMIMVIEVLKNRKLIIYQTSHSDFRASITEEDGITFVETTSFTDPELPIVIPE